MRQLALILVTGLTSSITLAAPFEIHVSSNAHQYTGVKNYQVYTKAEHDIEIINNTNQPKSFSYVYSYCADFKGCVNNGNNVTVLAHQRWNNHYDSYFNPTYQYDGDYTLTATTTVYGDTEFTHHDYGYISVR